MKTKRSRILLSGVSVLLVLSLLVGGTMAWFTDTEKVDANFSAGVLDIGVKPGTSTKATLEFENLRPLTTEQFDAELKQEDFSNQNQEGFSPAPVYFQPVTITNNGTLPAYIQITAESMPNDFICPKGGEKNVDSDNDGKTLACTNGLKDKLKIFVYAKNGSGRWTRVENVNLNKDSLEDGEVDKFIPSKENFLAAMNGSVTYVIGGHLPKDVDNAYQGKHFHGNVVVNAYQTDEGAGVNPSEDPDTVRNTIKIHFKENANFIDEQDYMFTANKSDKQFELRITDLQGIAPKGYKIIGMEDVRSAAANSNGLSMTIPLKDGKLVDEAYRNITVFVEKDGTSVTNQITVRFRNSANGQLLTEEGKVALNGLGSFTITSSGVESDKVKVVAAPSGYTYDPSSQSKTVTVTEAGPQPDFVVFTVKANGETPPIPPEPGENFTVTAKFLLREDNSILVENRAISLTGSDFNGGTQLELVAATEVTGASLSKVSVDAPDGCVFNPATQSTVLTYTAADKTISPPEVTFIVDLDNQEGCPYPHILQTRDDLDKVRYHMGHNFIVANDIDIFLPNKVWTPLGGTNSYQSRADASDCSAFTGNFYGAGHTISGLEVARANGSTYYWDMYGGSHVWYADYNGDELTYNRGLFAWNNGKINGVKLANVKVQASALAGALAGKNGVNGVIENCQVTDGSVEVDFMACVNASLGTTMPYSDSGYTNYGALAGGLVGANAGRITGCSSAITARSTAPWQVWVGHYGELFPTSIDNIQKNTGNIAGLNIGSINS